MDSVIFAMVRQVAATWYAMAGLQGHSAEQAGEVAMQQASLFLSDLGIVEHAGPYLDGARKALGTAQDLGFGA
ncbi:hypothetical protein LAJ19_12895 [Deinococcus taeanensis]|uniref:hypothetical protein n=1 Tax=Deinococcus taeanensis TaxID=2737050 RepID=UPI001CDD01B9|nr:hypothetical protein [Deinococcus taeanensis]UBV42507.1 hypothetical protein LAJ19_12895 [Deinococcus taeanensis]